MRKKWISIICAVIIMVCASIKIPEGASIRSVDSACLVLLSSGKKIPAAYTGAVMVQTMISIAHIMEIHFFRIFSLRSMYRQAESTDLIEAPSGILMEAQTGTVVYQKDADTRRSPASIKRS